MESIRKISFIYINVNSLRKVIGFFSRPYLAARWWLRNFAYRTSVPLWIFGAAAVIAIVLGFAATSYHSLRAASSDPVKSLRYE